MFLETFLPLKCFETLLTHKLLLVSSTVIIESLLVTLILEADLTGMVLGADVALELEEVGQIHLVAHLASEPCPGCGGCGWAAAHVGDERAVVQEHVLANSARGH